VNVPVVTELNIYPIKSCRGFSVETAEVEPRGLAHGFARDRRYMVVDANGRFLTQRLHPRMSLIDVSLGTDGYVVEAPGMSALRLPPSLPDPTDCEVRIWKDTLQAGLADADTNLWFSEYLGFACGLAFMGDHQHRPVGNASAVFDDEVSFADGSPLLLISEASLAGLNEKLPYAVPMRRFRPNVVVTADRPHAEDDWRAFDVGGARFDVGWPCERCILPTVVPETGERSADGEPLATLRSYRRFGAVVLFGQNLLPRRLGTIRVGDTLDVETKNASQAN
jgi:MOSC domain-containing protein